MSTATRGSPMAASSWRLVDRVSVVRLGAGREPVRARLPSTPRMHETPPVAAQPNPKPAESAPDGDKAKKRLSVREEAALSALQSDRRWYLWLGAGLVVVGCVLVAV